jgi:hypothetical protein
MRHRPRETLHVTRYRVVRFLSFPTGAVLARVRSVGEIAFIRVPLDLCEPFLLVRGHPSPLQSYCLNIENKNQKQPIYRPLHLNE